MSRPIPSVLAAISPLALMAGCASAPSAPPFSTIALSAESPSGDGVPAQWWRLYGEPALDALVAEALTHNRDLQEAGARLEQVHAALREAEGQRLPQTEFSAGVGTGSTLQDQIAAASRGSSDIRTGSRFDLGAELSWEVDLFGRLKSSVRAARADSEAEAALLDGVRVAVAAQVVGGWVDACGVSRQLDAVGQEEALAQQRRDILLALRAAGAASASDVAEGQAEEARIAAIRAPLEVRRHDALTALAVLVGRVPGDVPEAAAMCDRLPVIAGPAPDVDARALLKRRPDVRAAERRLAAGTARIGVAVGDLYPRISIGSGIASSSPTADGLGVRDNMVWRVGPLLSWSFPNISAGRARLAAARAGERAELAHFDATILTALQEASNAAAALDGAMQAREALRRAAERGAQAADLARRIRSAGGTGALQALAADRASLADRTTLAEAETRTAAAQVALFRALGGGWEAAPEPAALPLIRANHTDLHQENIR